jgi:hypothetical protein
MPDASQISFTHPVGISTSGILSRLSAALNELIKKNGSGG